MWVGISLAMSVQGTLASCPSNGAEHIKTAVVLDWGLLQPCQWELLFCWSITEEQLWLAYGCGSGAQVTGYTDIWGAWAGDVTAGQGSWSAAPVTAVWSCRTSRPSGGSEAVRKVLCFCCQFAAALAVSRHSLSVVPRSVFLHWPWYFQLELNKRVSYSFAKLKHASLKKVRLECMWNNPVSIYFHYIALCV